MKCLLLVSGLVVGTFAVQQDTGSRTVDVNRQFVLKMQGMATETQQGAKAALVRDSKRISRFCDLKPEQLRRLEVAAGGVVKRAFASVREEVAQLLEREEIGAEGTQAAKNKITTAMETFNKITEQPYWKKTVKNTLTDKQWQLLIRNESELTDFRNTFWTYTVIDELDRQAGPFQFEHRNAMTAALKDWVQDNGRPSTKPNPRTRRWWPTVPKAGQQVVAEALPESDAAAIRRLRGWNSE